MKRIEAHGVITDQGDLKLFNRELFLKQIKESSKGKQRSIRITLVENEDNISSGQRRYFFGVVARMIQSRFMELGDSYQLRDVVFFLKNNFMFRERVCKFTGEIIKELISLSDSDEGMTKPEFQHSKEAIQQWATEKLDLYIPDPKEKVKFKEEQTEAKSEEEEQQH